MYQETNKEFFTSLREKELSEMTLIQLATYKHWLEQQDLLFTQNDNNGNNCIKQRDEKRTDSRR